MSDQQAAEVATFTLTVSRTDGFDFEDLDAEAVPMEVAVQVEAGINAVLDNLRARFGETFTFTWTEQ